MQEWRARMGKRKQGGPEDAWDKAAGELGEALGKMTGDKSLEAEGRATRKASASADVALLPGLIDLLLCYVDLHGRSHGQTEPGITQRRATAEPGRNAEILSRVRTRQPCPPVRD